MLETIFSWLLSAVGEGLQLFVNFFFGNGNDGGLLNFTLGDLYQNFPYFGTAYAILQACGLGLVLAIAAVNLFKIFLGNLSKAQDTPTQILVRAPRFSFISAAIFFPQLWESRKSHTTSLLGLTLSPIILAYPTVS